MKIVFLGTHPLAQIVLHKLIASQFKPELVITGHDRKLGRGQALIPTSVKLEAGKSNIAVSYEISAIDKSFDLAILVAYGKIIPKKILQIPKLGFLNVHPSLLPKYRGPLPIASTIANGENLTGVTIMVLDEELDHGPILAQKEVEVEKSDTNQSLTQKLSHLGADLLIQILPLFFAGKIKPQTQNHTEATYTEKITKEVGRIELENPPNPEKLDRMIRAFYPWPGVWTIIGTRETGHGTRIKFLPPTLQPSNHPSDPFLIQPEGKRPMTIKEFLNGYPNVKELVENLIKPKPK